MIEKLVTFLNEVVWSKPLVYGLLITGVLFTLRMRFFQVRHFKEMIRLMFQGEKSPNGISSFQAIAMSLAGRVGTGNIVGVSTAIFIGGPGAVFWMWITAFLGASSAFIESTLGQIFKRVENNEYRGGPAYYIEYGIGGKFGKIYGIIFAIVTIISVGLLLPGVQSNAIASSMHNAIHVPQWLMGGIVVVILGLIIFGGVRSIANVATAVCTIYGNYLHTDGCHYHLYQYTRSASVICINFQISIWITICFWWYRWRNDRDWC